MLYEECTLEEVLAYRELENKCFDFGEGLMSPSSGSQSEDAYYEMRIQWEEELQLEQEYNHLNCKPKPKVKVRPNQYARKQICKAKLNKLHDEGGWWTVWDKGTHKIRHYISPRAKHYKKYSNKKVRKTKNIGNYGDYRKVYDFWWEVL